MVDPKPEPALPKELGTTGLEVWSGQVREEFLKELTGLRGYKVYREMSSNDGVVGGMLFAIEMLIRSVPWRVVPGGQDAIDIQAADFLETNQDDMEHTWGEFVAEVLSMLPYGYSLHEPVYKRRQADGWTSPEGDTVTSKHDDGRVGWRKIPIRSQATISDWLTTPKGELLGAVQASPPTFFRTELPLTHCLLFRPHAHKQNPEGRSILRTSYRPWFRKKHIENLEGIGVERDLVGVPVAGVPQAVVEQVTPEAKAAYLSFTTMVTQIKNNESAGVVMPLVYDDKGNKRYTLELLSVASRRLFDTGAIIERESRTIAQSVLADFLMLGHEAVGSFALADSKTKLFAVAIGAWLGMICDVLNRTAVPRLFALNPEFAKAKLPQFDYDDIETPDLEKLGNYLLAMSGAGVTLFPDEELEAFLRRAGGMPERSEEDVDVADLDAEPDDEDPEDEPAKALEMRKAQARRILKRRLTRSKARRAGL